MKEVYWTSFLYFKVLLADTMPIKGGGGGLIHFAPKCRLTFKSSSRPNIRKCSRSPKDVFKLFSLLNLVYMY